MSAKRKVLGVFGRRTASIYRNQRVRSNGAAMDYQLPDLRALVLQAIDTPCPGCGRLLTARTFGIDHARPVGRGGTWLFENLAVLCMGCNTAKGPLTADEWAALLAAIAPWPETVRRNLLARLKAGSRFAKFRQEPAP